MVPIEDNYNFYAFNNILKSSFEIHNYGTPAEQLHNVFNKLNTLDESKYNYIVYGLTPNDFFDLVDGSLNKKLKASKFFNVFEKIPQILKNIKIKDSRLLMKSSVKKSIKIANSLIKGQGRILVRKSGTEPKIRIMGESKNRALLKKCIKLISKAII